MTNFVTWEATGVTILWHKLFQFRSIFQWFISYLKLIWFENLKISSNNSLITDDQCLSTKLLRYFAALVRKVLQLHFWQKWWTQRDSTLEEKRQRKCKSKSSLLLQNDFLAQHNQKVAPQNCKALIVQFFKSFFPKILKVMFMSPCSFCQTAKKLSPLSRFVIDAI